MKEAKVKKVRDKLNKNYRDLSESSVQNLVVSVKDLQYRMIRDYEPTEMSVCDDSAVVKQGWIEVIALLIDLYIKGCTDANKAIGNLRRAEVTGYSLSIDDHYGKIGYRSYKLFDQDLYIESKLTFSEIHGVIVKLCDILGVRYSDVKIKLIKKNKGNLCSFGDDSFSVKISEKIDDNVSIVGCKIGDNRYQVNSHTYEEVLIIFTRYIYIVYGINGVLCIDSENIQVNTCMDKDAHKILDSDFYIHCKAESSEIAKTIEKASREVGCAVEIICRKG